MKICYIFGAAEGMPKSFNPQDGDLVIAADGGLSHLKRLGAEPDLIVGDFDSLGRVPEGENVIKHPVRKDDTDTLLAVKTALGRGFNDFVLYGCTGKRLDHTVANFQVLAFVAAGGGRAFLCGEDFTAVVIKDGNIKFKKEARGCISVFAFGQSADGVDIKGLSYELCNARLSPCFPVGTSNEFTGKASEISVRNGALLIIWQGEREYVER